jgi:hypothetical protein
MRPASHGYASRLISDGLLIAGEFRIALGDDAAGSKR